MAQSQKKKKVGDGIQKKKKKKADGQEVEEDGDAQKNWAEEDEKKKDLMNRSHFPTWT